MSEITDITWTQQATDWAESAETNIRAAVTLIVMAQQNESRRDDLMQGAYAAADDALQLLGDAINALGKAGDEQHPTT